ncbi:hypothetical protein BG011_005020 [Mortierella polycephala]|uniref:Uncharacterized protein n=1 Tax=Mortierella polycephala TaxID=41804 RepID=A0A9P6U9R6_9FUNG|nr:hypothetical protein BG011_005020 [Mortierella polycephala]
MAEYSDQQHHPRAVDAVMPQPQQPYTETQLHEQHQQQHSRLESVYSQDNDHSTTQYTPRDSQHQTDVEDIGQAEIDMSEPVSRQPRTRGKRFRLWVMKITTVPRLRLLWGLLALFGTMSWLAVMPAYAFSWIFLAANEDGAKTSCTTGPLSTLGGYATQCRGVNVAIALNVVVFLLWIPISIVIVCGTLERGMWWWGKGDGWTSARSLTRRSKMVSEEEFDLKTGAGQKSRTRQNQEDEDLQDLYDDIQQSKPAFVTPIASQFRKPSAADMGLEPEEGAQRNEEYRQSDYSNHHQQYQQQQHQNQQAPTSQQEPTTLARKVSTKSLAPSLTSRLSTFFGAGWSSGPMPPVQSEALAPPGAAQRRLGPSRLKEEHAKPDSEIPQGAEPDKTSLHGDAYTTQWHNRRNDEWS